MQRRRHRASNWKPTGDPNPRYRATAQIGGYDRLASTTPIPVVDAAGIARIRSEMNRLLKKLASYGNRRDRKGINRHQYLAHMM